MTNKKAGPSVLKQSGTTATSYDVARRIGVSQATVSRCFKKGAYVAPATRAKVLAAAEELGYHPNAFARGLITRRTNLVAVIITNLTNLHYPEVLTELTQRFSSLNVRVLLFALSQESDVDAILEHVWSYRVDGAVVAARLSSEQIKQFQTRKIPLVLYNRVDPKMLCDSVRCDSESGERQLVQCLVAGGSRRFGIIAGPADSYVGEERVRAAKSELATLGFDDVPVIEGNFDYTAGGDGLRQLFKLQKQNLDAVVCANDTLAFGALDVARHELGLSVPDQISIVGFNGVDPAGWTSYNLTTIRQPVRRMTEAAVSMLMARVENAGETPEARIFSGELVLGTSARLALHE